MSLLFSYGTLQLEHIQMALFGRLLHGQQDELPGYELQTVEIDSPLGGKVRHSIVTFNGNSESRVRGTVLEISEEELSNADSYEPGAYKRVAATLASGKKAWVYADARDRT